MANLERFKYPFKLALSMVLFFWLAFYMNWDLPKYGAIAIMVISLDTRGASLQKGLMRVLGTTAGLVFGVILLIFFLQDRWGNMIGLAVWLTFCVYYMQGSKFEYAWHVAAFLPLVIWADSYLNPQYAFEYSVYRYLETTAGVLIYTTIDTLLWPKSAAAKLKQQTLSLAGDIHRYFNNFYSSLKGGKVPDNDDDLDLKIAGSFAQTSITLGQALTDTSDVKFYNNVWEDLMLNTRSQFNILEIISNSVDDYKLLSKEALLEVNNSLNSINKTLNRIDELGKILNGKSIDDSDDNDLLQAISPIDRNIINASSRREQMILISFNLQIENLDKFSRNILKDLRILAGLDDTLDVETDPDLKKLYQRSNWQPERLYKALFVPLAFCIGYVVWIYINPITGQSIPEMLGILGIVVISSKLNSKTLLKVLMIFLIALGLIIAPIYFFLMPALSTGPEILSLVFVYTFIAGIAAEKINFLKIVLLMSLLSFVGITNVQTYSVFTLADSSVMLSIILFSLALLIYILNPRSVEQNLMHKASKFFNGSHRIIQNINVNSPDLNLAKYKVRKRYFESTISPIPGELRGLKKNINYTKFPENSSEDVNNFVNGIQNIAYKMHELSVINMRFVKHSDKFNDLFRGVLAQLQEQVSGVFINWSRFNNDTESTKHNIEELHKDINEKLDIIQKESESISDSNELIEDLYIFFSGIRGLVTAMSITQKTMLQIDWSVWKEKQF